MTQHELYSLIQLPPEAVRRLEAVRQEIDWTQAGFSFAASIVMLIPAVFVFIMGQDYLEQGIIYSGLKQ